MTVLSTLDTKDLTGNKTEVTAAREKLTVLTASQPHSWAACRCHTAA